ncbi:vanadium-dependent haloperoxidase [Micromonospora sp. NPDC004336]
MGWFTSTRRWGAVAVAAVSVGTAAVIAPASPAQAAGPTDHVLYWNQVLVDTFRAASGMAPGPATAAPGPLARSGAMMHGAIYDAANSVLCVPGVLQCLGAPYRIQVPRTIGVKPDLATAIDYAAYDVLRTLYPTLNFDDELAAAQEGIAASPARTDGQRMGSAAAQAMIDFRANDGSADTTAYAHSETAGSWRPTQGKPAVTPNWGRVKPFGLTSGSQFRPGPPLGISDIGDLLRSEGYAAQVDEVRRLGRHDSTQRRAGETRQAFFWANDLPGSYLPPGQLFEHTQIMATQGKLTQAGNAKLFALVAFAMADAAITAWDAKYQTGIDLWRPETAIQEPQSDGNSATVPDPTWQPLSVNGGVRFSPSFPSYTSGHATFAGAWAGVMRGFFGSDSFRFNATTEDPNSAPDEVRWFTTFTAAAAENARSRVYLGVHYQFDADAGLSSGTSVANHLTANYLRPTATYEFDGFYIGGSGPLTSVQNHTPGAHTISFGLRSGSSLIADPGAVVGTSWNGWTLPSSVGTPTFNTSTSRFEIPVTTWPSCAGKTWTLTILLRDGTSHPISYSCAA